MVSIARSPRDSALETCSPSTSVPGTNGFYNYTTKATAPALTNRGIGMVTDHAYPRNVALFNAQKPLAANALKNFLVGEWDWTNSFGGSSIDDFIAALEATPTSGDVSSTLLLPLCAHSKKSILADDLVLLWSRPSMLQLRHAQRRVLALLPERTQRCGPAGKHSQGRPALVPRDEPTDPCNAPRRRLPSARVLMAACLLTACPPLLLTSSQVGIFRVSWIFGFSFLSFSLS